MKITEITYKQNFAYNPIQMEHIHLGVTIEINDDKEAERAFEMAKQMVHETYENILKSMPVPLYEDHAVPDKQVDKPTDKIQGTLDEIEKCLTLDELQGFWMVSKGNLITSSAWKAKEKQLKYAK